jgi:hypothetical protein
MAEGREDKCGMRGNEFLTGGNRVNRERTEQKAERIMD